MKYAPTSNLTMTTPYPVFVPLCPLGKGPATKSDEFLEKLQRGVIFNPKIYVADFGNFKQGFLSMKLIQKE